MKILYISLIDWLFTKQRPQHIAELLSHTHSIHYICQISWHTKYLKLEKGTKKNYHINNNLTITRNKFIPLNRIKIINFINTFIYKKIVSNKNKKYIPGIIWVTHPTQYKLIPKSFDGMIIYDCMDNYSAFLSKSSDKQYINKLEENLVNSANLIITSSNGLYRKLKKINESAHVAVVKNAVELSNFSKYYYSLDSKEKPFELSNSKKIIGYFGIISSWFDVDLLIYLAKLFVDYDFIIIGPIRNDMIYDMTNNIPNIKLLGAKKYVDLPKYLYYFDICIMPFIVNELIKDVNPVKIYEYLSMGKPVVAPRYKEIEEFGEYIYLSESKYEFAQNIKIAASENDSGVKEKRIKFCELNTWNHRIDSINNLITQIFKE